MIPSSLRGINRLIRGYSTKCPIAIFGPPMSGKSILCLQEAYFGADGKILLIDTEGGSSLFTDLWGPKFAKRFNKNNEIIYKDARKLSDLFSLFGFSVDLKVSDKGKIDLLYKGTTSPKIMDYVKEGVTAVILDSLSNPIRVYFPGGQQNFPARADAGNLLLSGLHTAAIDGDLLFFVTHHETVNPTNPYALPTLTGGSTIKYNFKVILYLSQRSFKPHKNVRDLFLVRYFDAPEWEKHCTIILEDDGYRDITEEELAQLAKKKGGAA